MRLHFINRRGIKVTLLASVALLSLFVSGCATATRIPLDASQAPRGPVEGVYTTQTQEMQAAFTESNLTQAAGGGLLFALIDAGINSSRAKNSESVVLPLRDAMVDYDANTAFFAALRSELSKGAVPIALDNIQIQRFETYAERLDWVKAHLGKPMLTVNFNYIITKEMNAIDFTADVSLYGENASKPVENYRNRFCARILMPSWPGGQPTQPEAIKIWANDHAAKARLVIATGIKEIAQMIAYDISQPGPPDRKLYLLGDKAHTYQIPAWWPVYARFKGTIVHTEAGRSWVRLEIGPLMSMPQP